ncbi:M14 family zinc carboxypeptidase [Gephyromycinifex aptenodytis]|uniref:M14 family zinc carboxypeptidase n=1 Tax=Gephyromycinifex aptenodytis TaxID=2716227 RepID=UPI0014459907|nr:M14 family zinc carboxypeptidase [Gephyromycinifex aptenodytis]
MRPSRVLAVAGSLLLTGSVLTPIPSAAAATADGTPAPKAGRCDSVTTTPTFRGKVPSPSAFIGYELGRRKVTSSQVNGYLKAVDKASDHVVSGTFGRSSTGTPLTYALVGRSTSPARMKQIKRDITRLQDPSTPAAEAAAIAARTPVVIWLMGAVHGNEPASADAQLRVLHELADRSDCVTSRILDDAIVGIVPLQNPDGRDRNTRASAAAFDLNRDWFARTQPETRAKMRLLRSLPGQVVIDEHGMGGKGYYFPPNSDPIYHEAAAQPTSWINGIFGRANSSAFTASGLSFETYEAGFDLFYPGYGDTSPTLNFGAAGMTFEVGQEAPFDQQVNKHYVSAMASLYAGAQNKRTILRQYHQQWVQAKAQGQACQLQPNRTQNPGNSVTYEVPGRKVCGYFLREEPGKERDLARIIGLLQDDGVSVHRLTAPLVVPDYKAYGRPAAKTTLPAGTYWVSLAQRQKHWVQTMLGENTYVPFPYFYDVSGWSAPLRANVAGGYTGHRFDGARMQVAPKAKLPKAKTPASPPSIAVLTYSASATNPSQSTGWLQWKLGQDWRLPFTTMLPSQLSAAALKDVDVLLVPDLDAKAVAAALGTERTSALKDWVDGGGHLVAWRGGARLAATSGLTTTMLSDPKQDVPGVLIRANVTRRGPLTAGVGEQVWAMYNSDPILKPARPADAILTYPGAKSPDWFVSGFAPGSTEVAGTAAATSESLGSGTVTLFAFEPNFRGFTDGSATLIRDAILASRGTILAPKGGLTSTSDLTSQRAASARAAKQLDGGRPDGEFDTRASHR